MGKRLTHQEFTDKLKLVNNNVLVLERYKRLRAKIKVQCLTCNHVWCSLGLNLISGHGCPQCKFKHTSKLFSLDKEQYLNLLHNKRPDLEINEETYISSKDKVDACCKVCGHKWNIVAYHLLKAKRCPVCSKCSHGESLISKWLNEYNIKYISQFTQSNLVGINGGLLSYDFYIPSYNLLIEFQGEQHYKPIKYFGGNEKLEYQKVHDIIKKEYARDNNFNFLEISYKDISNINSILEERIVI